MTADHGGNRVRGLAARLPQKVTALQRVGADFVRAVDDHLRRAVVFDDLRRAPARGFVALLAPEFLASHLIERRDKVGAFVIPIHDQRVAVECGRCAFAEAVARLHVPEILFPFHVAVEVHRVEAARAKVGIEHLPISDGRS
jgi:hypothetical protein